MNRHSVSGRTAISEVLRKALLLQNNTSSITPLMPLLKHYFMNFMKCKSPWEG